MAFKFSFKSPQFSLKDLCFVKYLQGRRVFTLKDFVSLYNSRSGRWSRPGLSWHRQNLIRRWAEIFHVSVPGIYQAPSYKELHEKSPQSILKFLNRQGFQVAYPTLSQSIHSEVESIQGHQSPAYNKALEKWSEFFEKFSKQLAEKPPSYSMEDSRHPFDNVEVEPYLREKYGRQIERFKRSQAVDPIVLTQFPTSDHFLRRLERQKLVREQMAKMGATLRNYKNVRVYNLPI